MQDFPIGIRSYNFLNKGRPVELECSIGTAFSSLYPGRLILDDRTVNDTIIWGCGEVGLLKLRGTVGTSELPICAG